MCLISACGLCLHAVFIPAKPKVSINQMNLISWLITSTISDRDTHICFASKVYIFRNLVNAIFKFISTGITVNSLHGDRCIERDRERLSPLL